MMQSLTFYNHFIKNATLVFIKKSKWNIVARSTAILQGIRLIQSLRLVYLLKLIYELHMLHFPHDSFFFIYSG